jgi:hypothetical protein
MDTRNSHNGNGEVDILGRILSNGKTGFPLSMARYLLRVEFNDEDKKRMHDLAAKNQSGLLSAKEVEELHGYAKAGCLLGILQSKARAILRKKKTARSTHG